MGPTVLVLTHRRSDPGRAAGERQCPGPPADPAVERPGHALARLGGAFTLAVGLHLALLGLVPTSGTPRQPGPGGAAAPIHVRVLASTSGPESPGAVAESGGGAREGDAPGPAAPAAPDRSGVPVAGATTPPLTPTRPHARAPAPRAHRAGARARAGPAAGRAARPEVAEGRSNPGLEPTPAGGIGAPIEHEPSPLVRVAPAYPVGARNRGVQGSVVIEFTIDPDGTVSNPQVVEASPPGVFEGTALEAVRQWRFTPRLRGLQAVPARARQTIRFALRS